VDGVAARSGVHKTTVYRRWGSVQGLIAEALEMASGDELPEDVDPVDAALAAARAGALSGGRPGSG
jgi:AcrR family transcriptional regulator